MRVGTVHDVASVEHAWGMRGVRDVVCMCFVLCVCCFVFVLMCAFMCASICMRLSMHPSYAEVPCDIYVMCRMCVCVCVCVRARARVSVSAYLYVSL